MPVSAELYKRAMAQFASGVTVVTARAADGLLYGHTASAFCSVSLDPPLVLVCVGRTSNSHDGIAGAGWFGVNILSQAQEPLSRLFAGTLAKFEDVEFTPGPLSGSPRLPGVLAFLECRVVNAYDGGDHTIYVGQVEHAEVSGGNPLVYFRGSYRGLAE